MLKHREYEERVRAADRVADILWDVLEEEGKVEHRANAQIKFGAGLLALSPVVGPVIGTVVYGVGLIIGIVTCLGPPRNIMHERLVTQVTGEIPFERSANRLNMISEEYLDASTPEIPSYEQKNELSLVSQCATATFFTGCMGNCVLSRKKYNYTARARAPFFLLGALGLALVKYSTRYKHARNCALIEEGQAIRKRLLDE